MVPIRYGQQLLRDIRFSPLVVRSYPNVGDCKGYNQSHQHMKQKKSTRKHSNNSKNFLTTVEIWADNEHFCHLHILYIKYEQYQKQDGNLPGDPTGTLTSCFPRVSGFHHHQVQQENARVRALASTFLGLVHPPNRIE